MHEGFLFIISGPSGAGKGTLAGRLVEELDDVVLSISYTTRPIREGEVDGEHYFFLTEEQFIKRIEAGGFLECAKVHEKWLYGTPEDFVKENIEMGKVVVLEIDVQGFREVMDTDVDLISAFVSPSDPGELEKRIRSRAPISDEELARRMRVAEGEYEYLPLFDYFITNDDLETAVQDIVAVVRAERTRVSRRKGAITHTIRMRGKESNEKTDD
jgi:guanylate kinase